MQLGCIRRVWEVVMEVGALTSCVYMSQMVLMRRFDSISEVWHT